MNWIVALGLGVVGGYAYARVREARAQGVPLERALMQWQAPIVSLKMEMVVDGPEPHERQLPAVGRR